MSGLGGPKVPGWGDIFWMALQKFGLSRRDRYVVQQVQPFQKH